MHTRHITDMAHDIIASTLGDSWIGHALELVARSPWRIASWVYGCDVAPWFVLCCAARTKSATYSIASILQKLQFKLVVQSDGELGRCVWCTWASGCEWRAVLMSN